MKRLSVLAPLFVAVAAALPAAANPQPFHLVEASEPRLIGYAYAFEQATHHRVPSPSVPALPSDTITRR
jgi:hypothetical protein